MKAKLDNKIKTVNPNSNLRARSLAGPSSRAASSFVLASKLRKIPQLAIWVCSMLSLVFISNPVSALTYSDNVGVNFTFSPSLMVSLSSTSGGSSADLVINDLTPGTSSDSNVIDVNVISNNLSGYVLNSTVGNSTHTNPSYDTRNLVHSTSSSTTAVFTSLDYATAPTITSPSGFNDNTWGYSYATNYKAGSSTELDWSNYSGLPKYDDVTNITTLRTATGPSASTGDNTYFKIAAKASPTQASGTYSNVINFTVTAEHNPVSFYDAFKEAQTADPTITTLNGYYKMQDMTPAICDAVQLYDDDSHIQLIDTRDHEIYWIGKLKDNRCWLLDNLRLGSNDYETPLTPEDTNIETAWTLPKGITSGFGSYTNAQINAAYKNDTNVTSYGTASGKVGVYYNYCAASGGTYCHPENEGTGNAEYDICPANWRMPTGGENGEYQVLRNQYDDIIATNPTSFQYALSVQLSGSFYEAKQYNPNKFGNF